MDDLFAASDVNSVGYWNQRFFADWIAEGGRDQTVFFAQLCCRELPRWFCDDVRARRLSIFDYGCALGDALPVLRGAFPESTLRGGDVAEAGLGLARALHPGFEFVRVDAADNSASPGDVALGDVVYCSNTLEHLENWREILEALGRQAAEYLVILVPFEEDERIAEHVCTVEFDTLPARLACGMRLLHLSVVNTARTPETYWEGQQLIALYGNERAGDAAGRDGLAGEAICHSGAQTIAVDLRRVDAALLPALLAGAAALSRDRRRAAREAVAAAAARLEESAAGASAAVAEAEKQRALAAQLVRQRDAAQLAAAEAVHAELARMRDEQAATERLSRERAEKLDAAERELERMRSVAAGSEMLARLVSDASERMRLAGETETALRASIAGLAGELAGLRTTQRGGLAPRREGPLRRQLAAAARRAARRAAGARDWPAAARHYRRALHWTPASPAIWVQLGHALKAAGEAAAAEDAYSRALALDPSACDTHLQLAELLKAQGRWEDAAAAYGRALQLAPERAEVRRELDELVPHLVAAGDRARDRRDWPEAARSYRHALDRQPGLTAIWVQLGHALKEQGGYGEAEAAYRRALALDPTIADTHLQLGHLLKLTARRPEALVAYASALQLDAELGDARDALQALLGHAPSDADLAALLDPAASRQALPPGAGQAAGDAPDTPAERYGPLWADASRKAGGGRDVIWLGVIDWHYRIQRPQHLASHLADRGARVFYISLLFEAADAKGRFRILESPHPEIYEVRLRLRSDPGESIYRGLSAAAVAELQLALEELVAVLGVAAPVVVVEHAAWRPVACGVAGATIVYDCLDFAMGFSNAARSLAAAEAALVADADVVVAASAPLAEHVERTRPSVLVRNAADTGLFAAGFTERMAGPRPVIGYFGAIAEWFDIACIERCATARPDWEFRLIGSTAGCDVARAARLANVHFLGEKPYAELPALLREFDVALIPFELSELTRCTNPVKLYEYMAAGKAVVSVPLPEVAAATDMVYLAADAAAFEAAIARALAEDSPALRARRQAWAQEHSWANRARQLSQAIEAADPLVSVIVLTHNHWSYTRDCLASVRRWSDYPNLEIIVVDNASTDETPDRLRELAEEDSRVRLILNPENLGFPGGNNVGLRAAQGDYLILLNNDTVVTRGWVRDLIRPMQRDPQIGLVGPVTNNIGNEQKVRVGYRTMPEMHEWARRFARHRLRRTVEASNLAFFCVALRRRVMDEIGLLDEAYGIGFFEDDDYCRRARQANYRLVIADDVFVHHYLSVSFDSLGGKAAELMARNRAIFEARWGPWQPHRYREEPGFGC